MDTNTTPSKKSNSDIWKYFTKVHEKLVEFNQCQKQYVYAFGIGNYLAHLSSKHDIHRLNSKVQIAANAAGKCFQ